MFANEWIAVPAMAMVAHVGIPELPEPGAPGPFALADAQRTRGLLVSAGWSEVTVAEHKERDEDRARPRGRRRLHAL
jgi:hypothetical protein